MAFNCDVVMQPGATSSDGKLQGSERSPKSSHAVEGFAVPSGSVEGVPIGVTIMIDKYRGVGRGPAIVLAGRWN